MIQNKLQGIGACTLGTSFWDVIRLYTYYVSIRLNRKLGVSYFKKPRSVSITYKNLSFTYLIANLDDYRILEEMYINKQYSFESEGEIKTIVDIGSNVGTSIIYFLAEYPNALIYGYEPTSYCFDRLRKTVGNYKTVTIEKKAIDTKDGGVATIYIHPLGHSGSSNFPITGSKSEQIPTTSLDAIVQKHNLSSIDILKVDIEGLEYEVFKTFKNLSRVKYILVEIHPAQSGRSQSDFLSLLPNFTVIKIEENPYSAKTIQIILKRKS